MQRKIGMTIIEVVVALAIFMILVVMAYPILTQSGIINSESRKRQTAEAEGVLLTEYLVHHASGYKDKNEFMSGFLNASSADFNPFSCMLNVCSMNQKDIKYTIDFKDDNKAYIKIVYSRQVYESVAWLSYE